MSTLLEQVEAMLHGIINERVREDWAELSTAINGLSCSTREEALTRLRHLQADARNACALSVERTKALRERDAARAELAGVAAQRDAHLTRSAELATRNAELEAKTFDLARLEQDNAGLRSALSSEARKTFDMHARITELEARLAAAAPAEVDGFRVGDLIRLEGIADSQIESFMKVTGCWRMLVAGQWWTVGRHSRKPVEVGDTVRCVWGNLKGRGGRVEYECGGEQWRVTSPDGAFYATAKHIVAVAP
jgi:hypothetical protein